MSWNFNSKRRTFLKATGVVSAGLVVGAWVGYRALTKSQHPHEKMPATFKPNAWVQVNTDGTVIITVSKVEMGQGVWTSLAMLVAEELEVPWDSIRVVQASSDKRYGYQVTGGSGSVRGNWNTLREAGAAARLMLLDAAALHWVVPVTECFAERGTVVHAPSGRKLGYGALAQAASRQPLPKQVILKEPKHFKVIGTRVPRLDVPGKVNGRAVFGLDVRVPNMLTAVVTHCPVFGGKIKSINSLKSLAIPGARKVIQIDTGVAVVADDYWTARRAQAALEVQWDLGKNATLSSGGIHKLLVEGAARDGAVAQREGDVKKAFTEAARHHEAEYNVPFQAHATMEPMNCVAHVQGEECEIWAPTQSPTRAQEVASNYVLSKFTRTLDKARERVGLSTPERIRVNTTLLGCGLGRRLEQDYVAEAVQISKQTGTAVKVVWSREEDLQHDFYRPVTLNRLAAAVDKDGRLTAWHHRIIGPSINESLWPGTVKNGIDHSLVEGAIKRPYAIPNLLVEYVMVPTPVPLGFWRSVGHSHNAFVTECFLDEIAALSRSDSLSYRLSLLKDSPRAQKVLEVAADKAGWGRSLPEGRFHGLALHYSYYSYVAQVAEISISDKGQIRVHRVVCAVDCGVAINPETVAAQMEGGIVFGLTAALKGAITIRNGHVEQNNFHDYPLLRMDEMPRVDTHIVTSNARIGGIGEPGVPPIAPAVINAVFAASGKRLRHLPVTKVDLSRS